MSTFAEENRSKLIQLLLQKCKSMLAILFCLNPILFTHNGVNNAPNYSSTANQPDCKTQDHCVSKH